MALVLVKEDGSGKPDSNSYAAVGDGDSYHEGHLYAADWTGASATTKAAALVMATRLIDSFYRFAGLRAHADQALQWPRLAAADVDASDDFASNVVPKAVVNATIETARALIKSDRTADPEGEGLRQFSLTGTMSMTFDKADRAPVIPHVAQAMLSKLGTLVRRGAATARLVRV